MQEKAIHLSDVPLITVIGRGHGGTRAMSHTLLSSGVYIGNRLNDAGDKLPPEAMYDACRILAKQVTWQGDLQWDFSKLHTVDIDPEFERLIITYLADVLNHSARHRGWKIPETTLAYPWIVRMFPEARYIHWIRDPRDSIIRRHRTDDLRDFGIAYPPTDVERRRRAISWLYQYELMKSTPLPKHVIKIRFEDFVLHHERELRRLEEFLGIQLAKIVVREESIGRWKTDEDSLHSFDFLESPMAEQGYQ